MGNLSNIEVVPNANSFIPATQASLEHNRVIAVGRYDYQKGFDELIKIWKKIYAGNPNWRLDIFGDGPLKGELQNLIENLNLSGIVQLHPPVKNIEREYLESSILVMTSRYEGLPMALLEARYVVYLWLLMPVNADLKILFRTELTGILFRKEISN